MAVKLKGLFCKNKLRSKFALGIDCRKRLYEPIYEVSIGLVLWVIYFQIRQKGS